MSTNHTFDEETKTIYVVSGWNTSVEDFMEDEKNSLDDSRFKKGYNKFIDFSNATPGPTANFQKVEMFAEWIKSTQAIRGKCKWAVYAPDDEPNYYGKFFAKLTKKTNLEVKVFTNEDEAKKWLGLK